MARTFKDKLPKPTKYYKREDEYIGYGGQAHDPEMKKALKRELNRASRRALKREGLVEE